VSEKLGQANVVAEGAMVATSTKAPKRKAGFSSMINEHVARSCVEAHGKGSERGFDVLLHVYDIGPVSKWILNSWSAHESGLGAFHCGIEVLGIEWSFQAMMDCGDSDDMTGVVCHKPKSHPRHVYRESVDLGQSKLSANEICNVLASLERAWPARTYHFLSHNCTDFAEALASNLEAPLQFPDWAHGMAKGKLLKVKIAEEKEQGAVGLLPFFCGSWASGERVIPEVLPCRTTCGLSSVHELCLAPEKKAPCYSRSASLKSDI